MESLPEWKKDLLAQNWENEFARSLCELLQDEDATVTVVSDGGNLDQTGTLGWVIGIREETVWSGRGAARGTPMSA